MNRRHFLLAVPTSLALLALPKPREGLQLGDGTDLTSNLCPPAQRLVDRSLADPAWTEPVCLIYLEGGWHIDERTAEFLYYGSICCQRQLMQIQQP